MYDLVVVGSGPSGSRVAARAAGAGLRTLLAEEHPEVGVPVHCTGIVGAEMLERFELPEHLRAGLVSSFQVVSPAGRRFLLPGIQAWLLHRRDLDLYLAERARQAGAELALDCRVEEIRHVGHHVEVQTASRPVRTRLVVLATGAMSRLPERAGLRPPAAFHQTAQVRVDLRGLVGAEVYVGRDAAPGSFAYAVSVPGQAARLGVLARSGASSALDRQVERLRREGRLVAVQEAAVCRRIPMGVSARTVCGRTLSVGDAAGQAKTTTGGGLLFGLMGADLCADAILEAWQGGDFLPARLGAYDRRWKSRFRLELRAGALVRRLFEHVDDHEIEELMDLLETPEVRRTLLEDGDFDCHLPLLVNLTGLPGVRRAALRLAARRFPGAALLELLCAGSKKGAPRPSWRNT